MTFYSVCIVLTELMMLAMVLHVMHYPGFHKEQRFWYLCTFIAIMLCAGAEYAVHCGYYRVSFAALLTVVTVLQFSVAPLLAVLFSGSLGLKRRGKHDGLFVLLSFGVELFAAPFGAVFYFDEAGYHRGQYFFLYEALFVLSLAILIVSMMLAGRQFQHRDKRTVWMIILILIAGILPMAFYRLNVTYVAIAIAAILCYVYYNDLVQQDIQTELIDNQKKLTAVQEHIIHSLASLIESRDMETGEHVARTSAFVETLARNAMQDGVYADVIDEAFIDRMKMLAPMHDIGKIVVSDSILRKPGRLTAEEYEEMKKHAAAGGGIIREVLGGVADEDYMSFAADIATCHHEKWDGSGYPKGLSGEAIPLSARIMAIADVFDALVSERCYKDPIPADDAIRIIHESSGTHFDPKLVEVFLRHQNEFKAILS